MDRSAPARTRWTTIAGEENGARRWRSCTTLLLVLAPVCARCCRSLPCARCCLSSATLLLLRNPTVAPARPCCCCCRYTSSQLRPAASMAASRVHGDSSCPGGWRGIGRRGARVAGAPRGWRQELTAALHAPMRTALQFGQRGTEHGRPALPGGDSSGEADSSATMRALRHCWMESSRAPDRRQPSWRPPLSPDRRKKIGEKLGIF